MTAIINLPNLRPSLVLDFANSGVVDPRIKFSRASTATYFDEFGVMRTAPAGVPRIDYDSATGECRGLLVEEQRTNLLTYSEDFGNAAWTKTHSSITPNAVTAPDGAMTADKFVEDTTASTSHFLYQTSSVTSGTSYSASIYAKAAERSQIVMLVDAAAFSDATPRYCYFDVATATFFGLVGSGATASISNVGNGWYRCNLSFAASSTTTASIQVNISNGSTDIYTGDGTSGLYIWGAQLEEGSFPTSYIPPSVTFARRASAGTYFGSDGLIKTAASGEARYQYDPLNLTLAPKLLVEEQRTNLFMYSEQFDNAAWGKVGSTITANVIAAPDGTLTAAKLVENVTVNSTHSCVWFFTTTAGTPLTYSVYVKAAERSYARLIIQNTSKLDAVYDLTTGTVTDTATSGTASGLVATCVGVGNGWFRLTLSGVASTTETAFNTYLMVSSGTTITSSLYDGDGTSGIYVWGIQLEEGSYPTSYIHTEGSHVTRVADSVISTQATRSGDTATMTGASFSDWYRQDEGTLLADFVAGKDVAISMVTCLQGIDDALDAIRLRINSAGTLDGAILSDGADTAANLMLPVTANTMNKSAVTFKAGSSRAAMNGVLSATPDTPTTLPAVSRLVVGVGIPSAQALNGHVKRIAYYPRRITDEQLQTLTSI